VYMYVRVGVSNRSSVVSTLWPLAVGLVVVVVIVVTGVAVVSRSCIRHTRSRALFFRRQNSETSQSTVCTQMSSTGSSAVCNNGTLRPTVRAEWTAGASDAVGDSTDSTFWMHCVKITTRSSTKSNRLRHAKTFTSFSIRAEKFRKSFIPYCLAAH